MLRAVETFDASGTDRRQRKRALEGSILENFDTCNAHRYSAVYKTSGQADSIAIRLRWQTEPESKDNLPELETFAQTWSVAFPLPPSLPLVIEELLISGWCRPIHILQHSPPRYSSNGQLCVPGKLVFELCHLAGAEATLAFVGAAIHNYSRKRRQGKNMAWRMVSIKPKPQIDITVHDLGNNRLKVDMCLPADKTIVLRKLRDSIPRTPTSWRNDEHYVEVFRSIDLRKQGATLKQIGLSLGSGLRDANQASDRLAAFDHLVRIFGFNS
jgi:hypothetical protein